MDPKPPDGNCPYCKKPTKGWPYFAWFCWCWSFVCTTCLKEHQDLLDGERP